MSNSAVRFSFSARRIPGLCLATLFLSVIVLNLLFLTPGAAAQDSPKPLRASEVLALQAGGALPANLTHDIGARGLSFHPDSEFLTQMKKAGARAMVLAALNSATATADGDAKPDKELLEQLSDAAVLMKSQKYDAAAAKLSDALKTSLARTETGFVMGELLRQKEDFQQAAAVYGEILKQDPEFPEVHDKASYILYRLGDDEDALNEAKAALAQNPNDAEAHKNAGLALSDARKFDAAMEEYKEALRIKPDYAAVRYDLGLLYYNVHNFEDAIVEYKKAIAIEPGFADAHNNLGKTYKDKGDIAGAIAEFREAKRLNPNDPVYRQNLASALMTQAPRAAIQELRELEKKFPDFEMCHICLGNGLLWDNDAAGAEAEYRIAMKLDPSDPKAHEGLGSIQEKQKNYDGALDEYRIAERLSPDAPDAYESAGRVLMAKKDYTGAVGELKQADTLTPSSWQVHELYAQALGGDGQSDLAISEFQQAISLDPKQGQVLTELGAELEKKGDWVGALEQYRKGALTDSNRIDNAQPGEPVQLFERDPQKEYKAAQARFAGYLVSLKAAGKKDEVADLKKRVALLETSASTLEKVQAAMLAGDQAIKDRQLEDAEKSYKEAVGLADQLPPWDENLIVALGKLGNVYGMRRDFGSAQETFHRQLTIIEKTFGPASPRAIDALVFLGQCAAAQKNFTAAESYFSRGLAIDLKVFGENSIRTSEILRALAGMSMAQSDWGKAEPYLLRAVKASETATGPDDNMVLVPLWGLCDLYDRWGKPEKSQPCWHRTTEIMEKQVGVNSPNLGTSLANEANALRKLGRAGEAEQVEQRLVQIRRTSQE